MHVLPVLRQLEARYAGQPFLVIGVHSAKFRSEKDPQNIRKAVARHGITHPVAVDSEHEVWQQYAIRGWPTLVLVDATGRVAGRISGEPTVETLAEGIERVLAEGRERGDLAAAPLAVTADGEAGGLLRFPGRVLATPEGLFVSDTGHHRILHARYDGQILDVIGEGSPGDHDGAFSSATFRHPQGLAMVDGELAIADTENHRIRLADLEDKTVETVAGTGRKGTGRNPEVAGRSRDVDLRSPWALAEVGGGLVVAMAGSHQIWALDVVRLVIAPFAGSGLERLVDGELGECAFAQPSGLTYAGPFLFVADAETSSIRAIDLEKGQVMTVCGQGLFDFGDIDGPRPDVRMQHTLDVAFWEGALYVADAYNNKIKRIDISSGRAETFLGDGSTGLLHEPGGVSLHDGKIYIADTNHHRIRVADLATRELRTLDLIAIG